MSPVHEWTCHRAPHRLARVASVAEMLAARLLACIGRRASRGVARGVAKGYAELVRKGNSEVMEEEFKTIPDYVGPEHRKQILELAAVDEKEISDVECCEYLIRHWNETVEDGNPLYNDRNTLGAAASRTSSPSLG